MTATDRHDPRKFSLTALGARGYTDSAFWFPELHRRGRRGLVLHYALGMIGEIGEVEEAIFVTRSVQNVADELADVLIYAADLAWVIGIDLDGHLAKGVEIEPVMILVGRVANAVKKMNRVVAFTPGVNDEALDTCRDAIAAPLTALVRRTLTIARQFDVDPMAAIEHKREILCERWGVPS